MTHPFPTRRSSDLTGVEGMPEVRVTALRSAAQSFGARGGLAWRSHEINRMLDRQAGHLDQVRSEEHTSELQSLMRISYAVFCLKKKKHKIQLNDQIQEAIAMQIYGALQVKT